MRVARGEGLGLVERAVVQVLAEHPAGLGRGDLRALLADRLARELAPAELAQLDTRLGHALSRLKADGAVVHREHRRVWQRRAPGAVPADLPPPAAGGGPTGLLEGAEQDPLF